MPGRRRAIAAAGAIAVPLAAILFVCWFADRPVGVARDIDIDDGGSRAALAVRDRVSHLEELGTRLYTVPSLDDAYDEAAYLVEDNPNHYREYIDTLTDLLERYDTVDLFILAHGNLYYSWTYEIPPELRHKLRLVYNTGCSGAYQADVWLDVGATTYVGHPATHSMSPWFYFYFLRRWTKGYDLADAVESANARAESRVSWIGFGGEKYLPTAYIFGESNLWIGRSSRSL